MTLQKQTLFVLPLLMTTSFSQWSPSTKPNLPSFLPQQAVTNADSSLPYFSKRITFKLDSLYKPVMLRLPARPQMRLNSSVKNFVQSFLKKNRADLKETAGRGNKIFPVMDAIFEKHKLPVDLKYLAVVESDLKLKAHSHAGAVGYWQFMKGTARELGLKISGKTDERKHLRKSTNAAAGYLKSLYKNYGDWLLVIAAYNSGPGVVNKAIKKSGSRNFWRLQSHLPAETRGHVKRFIAIHYFFEDAVGETTLTKAERLAHEKELERFDQLLAEQNSVRDSVEASVSLPVVK